MCAVAVQKEALEEDRRLPVEDEKNRDNHVPAPVPANAGTSGFNLKSGG
jgi:hypothetical protein